ncbi:MAG: M20 family metallopeptidase [Clostridiales bacterium]|nr:M20 family metallopeptidase [Clostridiales bacterium]
MDNKLVKIFDWVDEHKEEIFEDILESVAIYSPSEDREAVSKAIDWFRNKAESMGFDVDLRAEGEVLSAKMGKFEKTLGLVAHCDVVPTGDLDMWTRNPLGERVDGKLYGRGVLDNKGPAVLCLWCMKGIRELMGEYPYSIETIIGSREEIAWTDIDKYMEEAWPLPEYSFTPDGYFPLYNREKGYCDVRFIFKKEGTSEEAELTEIKAADASNSVPGMAYAGYGDFKITAYGKEVHSASPHRGDNALIKLLGEMERLGVAANSYAELYRFNREKLSRSFDGADSLFLKRHPREINGEEMGYTTAVPTRAWLQGDNLILNINLRTVYGTTEQELHEGFSKVCEEYGCSYEITTMQNPLYVSKEIPFLKAMGNAYSTVTGREAEFCIEGGTSYAKAFPNCISFGPLFPESEDTFHVPDEYLTEEDILTAAKIYLASFWFFLANEK